jgi:hypothetical protein
VRKADFRTGVRSMLMSVPLETRRSWDETHLFGWWLEASHKDPNITWGSSASTLWSQVKMICADLIGPRAP